MPKGNHKQFTEYEQAYILDNYLIMSIRALGRALNVRTGRIYRFLDKKGLKIPENTKNKWCFIQKGKPPFNKGKKIHEYMSEEAVKKVISSGFKKGVKHKFSLPKGAVTVRESEGKKHKYIKLENGDWKLFHHVVWEKEKGAVPKGYVLQFKDNDTLNTDINNLELVSKIEVMYNNHISNYPKKIIPSLVLINQLNTIIKDKENEEGE